jgi:hypothetical protein
MSDINSLYLAPTRPSRSYPATHVFRQTSYLNCSPTSSSPFKNLAAETRRTRRNILEKIRVVHGDKRLFCINERGERVMLLTREHIQRIVNEKAATPFAQRNFLNTLRAVFKWAHDEGRIPDDPTLGVKRVKIKTTGYRTWSESDIELQAKAPTRDNAAPRHQSPPLPDTPQLPRFSATQGPLPSAGGDEEADRGRTVNIKLQTRVSGL